MEKKVTSIGGQALLEGVMMRGSSSMAMAVRNEDGFIEVESQRLAPPKWYNRVPLIRGVVAFVSSLYTGVFTLTRSAEAIGDEDEKLDKKSIVLAVVLAVILAVLLFMLVPEFAAGMIGSLAGDSVLIRSLAAGVIRILIFICYLLLVSRMKEIKRTFMYHGAEHRTINCYESGLELTVENVQKCSTRHNRCGTTFLFIVMVISIFVFAIINWLLDGIFPEMYGILENLVHLGIKLLCLPFVAGVSYEVLKAVAKMPDNLLAKILRAPGLALQRLTTSIPDDDMVEVAIKSFKTVLKMENDAKCPTVKFGEVELADVRAYIRKQLSFAEEIEADWILCDVLGVQRGDIPLIKRISADKIKKIKEVCDQRKSGQPLDYILGKAYFYGQTIAVNDKVLIPRMETEILVSEAIKVIGKKKARVLDLCTGSGCIAKALSANTEAIITASDISDDAIEIAKLNLHGTGVEIVKSDLFAEFEISEFDVIVSNPPYIPTEEIASLQNEVRKEPVIALDGGADGLDFYKRIITSAVTYLKPNGKLLLEIGYNQASAVKQLMYVFGFSDILVVRDLDGNDRVVVGQID